MSIEAMKHALEVLKKPWKAGPDGVADAIISLEEALAKQGEPIGTAGELFTNSALERLDLRPSTKIYTTPQQRTWVGLTDKEREQVINLNTSTGLWRMAKDIEAKLKEKNT